MKEVKGNLWWARYGQYLPPASDYQNELCRVEKKLDTGTFMYAEEVKRLERRRLELKQLIAMEQMK